MCLTEILIDSSSPAQIQDAFYQHLYNNARSVQFPAYFAFCLNSLVTLEPFLLQQKLALILKYLTPNISIHTGHGTAFQRHTKPLPSSYQGDNNVLLTSETPFHNVLPIETTSSYALQQVETLDGEANLPGIDVTSEIGSAGRQFDQMFEDFIQTPTQTQHASLPGPSSYQDHNNDGTLPRDMPSAQNIHSIEAGSNTASADYNMVHVSPDLARIAEGQILDNDQESHGFDYSPNIGNTDYDSQSYSDLTASTSIGQSSRSNSPSEWYPSSHDIGKRIRTDSQLGDSPGMESYPTPVSNPSHTPKSANRVLTKPRKARRVGGKRSASMLAALAGADFSPSSEADSVRLGLLRSLILKSYELDPKRGTCRSFNDEDLREIYRLGDRIISETARVLNDWSEWSSRELQPPNAVLSPCHHLSPVEICAVAFQFLMETHNGIHRKSVHRRLAQILLYNFFGEVEQGFTAEEDHGVLSRYGIGSKGLKPVTIANDLIIEKVGISEKNGKRCNRKEIGEEKSSGMRWWRLGSGIGVVTVLTCPSELNSLMDNRSFSGDSINLLVNYMRHAYPNAVAHFQSLDPVIRVLFANTSLVTNASVGLDPLYSRFGPISEQVRWFDTVEAMDAATGQLLRIFRQN